MSVTIDNIKRIIEKVLGRKLVVAHNVPTLELIQVNSTSYKDTLNKYLSNPELVNERYVEELIHKKLSKLNFELHEFSKKSKTWSEYLKKLDSYLELTKYRVNNDYAFQDILPTTAEFMSLLNENLELTEQWYGKGHGNINTFYRFFVTMCESSEVTSFKYSDINKYIAEDNYLYKIDKQQRRDYLHQHEKFYDEYVSAGGIRGVGRSVIDATTISNIMYYKEWNLRVAFEYAKKVIVQELGLDNFGQLPFIQQKSLWDLLQKQSPVVTIEDQECIFYKFAQFVKARPSEWFNYFSKDLQDAKDMPQKKFHDIIKLVGLETNRLVLIERDTIERLVAKRCVTISWLRKYPLLKILSKDECVQVRAGNSMEIARILPNELPYQPVHGLSLCGNELDITGDNNRLMEWNDPIDQDANIDNWPRDIEKIFREFKILFSQKTAKNPLLAEKTGTIFLNAMSYSTIHATQHTHISFLPQEKFLVYNLPANKTFNADSLNAVINLVQVGDNVDAMYIRIEFNSLENEALLKFLINMCHDLFKAFDGEKKIDCHLQLFNNDIEKYTLIFEPHTLLQQLENDQFLNPHNKKITPRKPQLGQPTAGKVVPLQGDMAQGHEYLKSFYDAVAHPGVRHFMEQYLHQRFHSQP